MAIAAFADTGILIGIVSVSRDAGGRYRYAELSGLHDLFMLG